MSSEFPFLTSSRTVTSSTSLPLFKMYGWDFETDKFQRDGNGHMILLEGNDALKIWIIKNLRTKRFTYRAYSWQYGSNLEYYIGKVMGVGERISELKREITESTMINPYVKSIDNIEFSESEHSRELQINISLTTIYGKLTV